MHLLVSVAAALALLPGAGRTDLRLTVWPQGRDGPSHTWTLRCDPAGGTLPRTARSCQMLASLPDPLAPIPPGTACTQVYGGPQVARVTGEFRGRRVWVLLQRRDGCEIARWNGVRFLFPVRT